MLRNLVFGANDGLVSNVSLVTPTAPHDQKMDLSAVV